MKKLKPGTLVYVEARDWMQDPRWRPGDQKPEPAPLGVMIGRVEQQDATTLTLNASWFPDKPGSLGERDTIQVPVGCIESVYPVIVGRDVVWTKRK
jgi:hypothetical protein